MRFGAAMLMRVSLLAAATATVVGCAAMSEGPSGIHWEARPVPSEVNYDEAPVLVTRIEPTYPEFAREAQIQGTVVLQVLIGRDGRVHKVRVEQGVTGLNNAAVDAAERWIFKPAMRSGSPVDAVYEIDFEFRSP
jgi:TonB family protein